MSRIQIRRPWRSQPRSNSSVNPDAEILTDVNNSIILYGNDKNWRINKGSRIASPVMTGVVAPGKTSGGEALLFNGVDTRLDFGTANIPTSEFTVVWGGTLKTIANFRGLADCINGGNGWTLFYSGTDTLWFSGNGYGGITNFSGWPTGVFHTGAFRYKSGVERAWFRNGVRLATEIDATSINTTIGNFWIGSQRGGGSTNLDGTLNFFYLFDRSLSDGEIIRALRTPYNFIREREIYVQTSVGGGSQTLTGVVATPSSSVSVPTLAAGGVTLSLSGAVPSSNVSTPSLTNGSVNIAPAVAIASSSASTPILTSTNTLSVTAPSPSSNAGVPSLTPGAVTLAPAGAVASSNAGTPTLQNGSSLAPSAAVASSSVSNPTLTVGAGSLLPAGAIASSSVSSGTLLAGGVSLTPSSAIATSTGVTPDVSSGSALTPSAATATSNVTTGTLTAGVANIIPLAASAASGGVTPSFTQIGYLAPAVATCGSIAIIPQLLNSGAGHSLTRLLVIDAEQRLFTIGAGGRRYSIPSELRTYS